MLNYSVAELRKIKFLFGSPFPWLPIRVSIHLRLASNDSPFVLRSIFDRSSIPERRTNEGWTKDERRSIENRTRTERKIYRRNCWLDCYTVSLLMTQASDLVKTGWIRNF